MNFSGPTIEEIKGGSLGFAINFASSDISVSTQACAGVGAGAYLGAGLTVGASKDKLSKYPDSKSATTSTQFQAEGDHLLAGGAQVDLAGNGGQVGFGGRLKGGVGAGGYAAVMGYVTTTQGFLSW